MASSLLAPWTPGAGDRWDFDAVSHLYRRAAFSAPEATIEAALRRSPREAVAGLVSGPARDGAALELDAIYPTVAAMGEVDAIRSWIVSRMIRCTHQLREKLALFWHGHFATSVAKVKDPLWMGRQYRIFLDSGLSKFPALLDSVARDPAMIRWLDNETNRKGHANENFARELMELFTLGVGNYTESDVLEGARAFTGWHIRRGEFHFAKSLFDDGEKRFLGNTGNLDGEDVLHIVVKQPACARFLARKLLVFFVVPEPSDEDVADFAEVLKGSGFDFQRSLKTLFSSRLFFSPRARGALYKSPLEFCVGAVRSLGLQCDTKELLPFLREMGQDLLAPPNVKGWPGGRSWIDTASWLARVNAAYVLTRGAPGLDRDAAEQALLGHAAPQAARDDLFHAAGDDFLHALLSLPEAHCN